MPNPPRMTTAFGETKSLRRWGLDERCLVSDVGLRNRLNKGWSPEEAISTPAMDYATGSLLVEAFGQQRTITGWSRESRCKVPYVTLYQRIRRLGWSAEAAITTPPTQ